MAQVDANDTTIARWIVTRHMIDPAVGYRRHVLLAAFDNAEEMERWMRSEQEQTGEEIPGPDWFSGRYLPIGRTYPTPQPRRRRPRSDT
jgi:hypothetical protein